MGAVMVAAALGCSGQGFDAAATQRQGVAVSPSFAFEASPAPVYETALVPPQVVDVGGATLLFQTVRVASTGLGEATVQRRDAAGAYVPGSLRGVPGTYGILYAPGERNVRVGSFGMGALLAGVDERRQVIAGRVDATGRPLDAAPIVVNRPSLTGARAVYGVACTSASCLVVHAEGTSLSATRVAADGRVLDAAPLALDAQWRSPAAPESVVAVGDQFVVTWQTQVAGSIDDIRMARVTADGRVLDPGGRPVTVAGGARRDVSVATDGSRVFLAWYAAASGARPTGVYTQVFDRDLAAVSALGVHPDLPRNPHALWDGAGWLVVYDTYVVRFDAAGTRLDATPRAIAFGGQYHVGAAPGGFYGYASAPSVLQRFDRTGAAVGGRMPTPTGYPAADVLARADSDGTDFAVGWGSFPRNTVARVRADGSAIEAPFTLPASLGDLAETPPALGLEGARVQWFGQTSAGTPSGVRIPIDLAARTAGPADTFSALAAQRPQAPVRGRGQRVVAAMRHALRLDASWARTDPAPIFLGGDGPSTAAFDGTNYLFVTLVRTASPTSFQVQARRMNLDGDLIDAVPVSLAALGDFRTAPQVAFGAGAYLLAWVAPGARVTVARVAPDLTASAPRAIATAGDWTTPVDRLDQYPEDATVTFNGTHFVVVWLDRRDLHLRALRVSPEGVALDAAPFVLTTDVALRRYVPRLEATVASDARGNTLVAYATFDDGLAAIRARGVFFRDDTAVVPDAGVDAAVDAREAGVDAAVVLDAGLDAGLDAPSDASEVGADAVVDAREVGEEPPPEDRPDASAEDVASPRDGGTDGMVDAAPRDLPVAEDVAAEPDAGEDAGDASVAPDASAPPPPEDGGCSTSPGGASGGAGWLSALALAAVRVRRRRGR